MRLTERYEIPVATAQVAPLFEDVRRLVPHVPGAEISDGTGEGPYDGMLAVAFGPRVIKLRGTFTYHYDADAGTGRLEGSGTDARGNSRATGGAVFSIAPVAGSAAGAPATSVDVEVDLGLTGPLATIAETGAPHVARSLFEQFSQSLIAQLRAEAAEPTAAAIPVASPPAARPLNGFRLMLTVLARMLRRRRPTPPG